jgi:hypothetical protein
MKRANMNYEEAMRAMKDEAIAEQEGKFYEMAPKSSEDIWGSVSTAPSQTVTGAIQAPQEQGIFAGSGGYEYGMLKDGSFMILKSGKGFNPGSIVKPGMKGYNAIKSEFEDVMAGRRPTEKPRASAPESRSPAPKATGPAAPKAKPAKPRSADSAKESARIADRLLTSLDGVERGEPPPKFGGMGEIRGSETGVPFVPKFEPPASMVGPSEADKRKELAQFSGSVTGNLKRAGLMDDARRGLMGPGLNREGADRTVTQLASQMSKGNYDSYLALKAFTKL